MTFYLCVMSCDATWVFNPLPILNWIRLTVPELGRLKFSITASLKSQFFFFWVQGVKFHLSYHQKASPWLSWLKRIMTYCACGCVLQRCDLCKQKRQKLSCVTLALCQDHPRRHSPLKFCIQGRVRKVVFQVS